MGKYAELLDRLVVKVSSPDGCITGKMESDTSIDIQFFDDSYYDYDEESLELQLASLARVAWAGRLKGRMDVAAESFSEDARPLERQDLTPTKREYRKRCAEIEAEGLSLNETICITSVGMRSWKVAIEDGLLDDLSEQEFLRELQSAVSDLLADHRMLIRNLKCEILGITRRT